MLTFIHMPTDPPLVNPKVEMPLELCVEEDSIPEPTFPQ